jgi:hypothetical protein
MTRSNSRSPTHQLFPTAPGGHHLVALHNEVGGSQIADQIEISLDQKDCRVLIRTAGLIAKARRQIDGLYEKFR